MTRELLRQHPLQPENAVRPRSRRIMMCLGEVLGRYTAKHPRSTRTKLIQAHILTSLTCSGQAGSFPRCSQQCEQSLFDGLTCPPQACYTCYLCWIGRERGEKKKRFRLFFKPICCLALKYAVSSLEHTFSVIRSLPEPVVAHSRVPLPSFIITCCSSETLAA